MAGEVKKLQFSEGTDIGAPTDLSLATSTSHLKTFASDAAFVSDKGSAATAGDCYFNTVEARMRFYMGGAWRYTNITSDPSDATKAWDVAVSGAASGTTTTLKYAQTANRTQTAPDATGTWLLRDDTATVSNKTLDNSTTLTIKDANLTIQDDNDVTKQAKFQLSGNTTGVTRTYSLPDASTVLVGTDNSQTLSAKTLTSPIINTPTTTDPTVKGTLTLQNTAGSQPTIRLSEDPDNGTNYIEFQANANMSGNYTVTLPAAQGAAGTFPKNDGSGNLTWEVPSGAQTSPADAKNYSVATSVSGNALTIALKDAAGSDPSSTSPVTISFRDSTLTVGTYVNRSITAALSVVVSSGSTLGHASAKPGYIYVYALDNAGTVELAVSSRIWDDGQFITTTAEGGAGAADSATAIYSTSARTSKAFKMIARLLSTQTTAGTWTAVPTENFSQITNDRTGILAYYNNANTTIANTGTTIIKFSTSVTDTHSIYDSSTGALTVNRTGLWTISGGIILSSHSYAGGNIIQLILSRNSGTTQVLGYQQVQVTQSSIYSVWGTITLFLATGDTISLLGTQNSSGSVTCSGNANENYFSACYVGAA